MMIDVADHESQLSSSSPMSHLPLHPSSLNSLNPHACPTTSL
jgi:hypothetical protein